MESELPPPTSSSSSSSAWIFRNVVDRGLERLDALNSTQLYIMTVTCMVLVTFLILSPAGMTPNNRCCCLSTNEPMNHGTTTKDGSHRSAVVVVKANTIATTTTTATPAVYGYLRIVNIVGLIGFVMSVMTFFQTASSVESSSSSTNIVLYRYLVGWSMYIAYFISFNGIPIIYDNLDPATTVSNNNHHHHHNNNTNNTNNQHTATNATNSNTSHTKRVLLPPACSTPVCSNPCSFEKTTTTKNVRHHHDDNNSVVSDNDQIIVEMVLNGQMKDHELEKKLNDCHRAVVVRRLVMATKLRHIQEGTTTATTATTANSSPLDLLPYKYNDVLDYSRVFGANCEIVVGYVPIPVGMVGPMTLNGQSIFIPMATTEGCLVASTNRGAKAITEGGGAHAMIVRDGITRAPCVRLPSARQAAAVKVWCEETHNFCTLKHAFESTTSFGKLQSCVPTVAGKNVYLRLTCFAGDAMGMNMVSKGSLAVIEVLQNQFPDLTLVALSGNMCTDKKAAATNWIEGRGKSVVIEATIPKATVQRTLKTTVTAIVHTNIQKNLIGSAMAGTIGGFNAHASNMVTAVFLATGQDPAQNVESSNCITILEECTETGDLWISCTMPSLEVGTVGGGTSLPAQAACLKAIGCQGGGIVPGQNAKQLAMVVAAAVLAGELSLLAALAANTLVAAHMQHNRKPTTSTSGKA